MNPNRRTRNRQMTRAYRQARAGHPIVAALHLHSAHIAYPVTKAQLRRFARILLASPTR